MRLHGLKRIGDQIDEHLLAELGVGRNFGQVRRVLALDFYSRVREGCDSGFEGAFDDFGNTLGAQLELRRAREIEESHDQRVQTRVEAPVHTAGCWGAFALEALDLLARRADRVGSDLRRGLGCAYGDFLDGRRRVSKPSAFPLR